MLYIVVISPARALVCFTPLNSRRGYNTLVRVITIIIILRHRRVFVPRRQSSPVRFRVVRFARSVPLGRAPLPPPDANQHISLHGLDILFDVIADSRRSYKKKKN